MKVASIQVQANDLKDFQKAWTKLEDHILEASKEHDLILVPECSFPAYFLNRDEGDLDFILSKGDEYLARIKQLAKEQKVYIAYGYAEKSEEIVYNSAILIDRNGEEVIKKRKSFLWHFDSVWFTAGDDVAVADTEFGKVGLVVCADARMPEIVKLAALQGAKFIIDLANLTATGPDISGLHNVQSAYMLSVRALENQVWLAVSDKWGVEANSITYAGRSGVFAPDGTCVYQAGSDSDEIVSVEIPTDQSGRILSPNKALGITREPLLYKTLVAEPKLLPIMEILEERVVPADITPFISVAAGDFEELDKYLQMISRLNHQGGQIICMPPVKFSISENAISSILEKDTTAICTEDNLDGTMTSFLITSEGIQDIYDTLHNGKLITVTPPVFKTRWGRIGIMHNKEALIPEYPRTLMLLGADCLVWPNRLQHAVASNVGRTRAAENRMFIVSAQAEAAQKAVSQIIDPAGAVIASTLSSEKVHAASGFASFTLSRVKEVVPGTSVVKSRRPHFYGGLVNEENRAVH